MSARARRRIRDIVFRRDHRECVYCRSPYGLTVDHVIPKSEGGAYAIRNLVTACRACNEMRGALSIERWLKKLARYGLDVTAVRKRVDRRLKRRTKKKHYSWNVDVPRQKEDANAEGSI